jgi:S1-C subfamily serine protease
MIKKYIIFSLIISFFISFYVYKIKFKKNYFNYAAKLSYYIEDKNVSIIGTGFSITKDKILTAGHFCEFVIKNGKEKEINSSFFNIKMSYIKNNDYFYANIFEIQKIHKDYDLCILYHSRHNLPILKIDIENKLNIGDKVFTIGSPSGIFPVETYGKVVSLDESFYNPKQLHSFIVSIPVFKGNSGGFVIRDGKIVGMIVRGFLRYTNISYAVKADKIIEFINEN